MDYPVKEETPVEVRGHLTGIWFLLSTTCVLGIEHRSSGLAALSAGPVFCFLIRPHVVQADLYLTM